MWRTVADPRHHIALRSRFVWDAEIEAEATSSSSPEDFGAFIRSEIKNWAKS